MRSLSLLDRETVRSGENGSVGIGAELFGMNVINYRRTGGGNARSSEGAGRRTG